MNREAIDHANHAHDSIGFAQYLLAEEGHLEIGAKYVFLFRHCIFPEY